MAAARRLSLYSWKARRPLAEDVPEQCLRSRSSYLSDRRQISGIENYGAVRYRQVYPEIDVRFYGREQHLEHDFLLASGADPDAIVIAMEGIDQLRINDTALRNSNLALSI